MTRPKQFYPFAVLAALLLLLHDVNAGESYPTSRIIVASSTEAKVTVNGKEMLKSSKGEVKDKDVVLVHGDVIGIEVKEAKEYYCAWVAAEIHFPDGTSATTGTQGWRAAQEHDGYSKLWFLEEFQLACQWEAPKGVNECDDGLDRNGLELQAQKVWAQNVEYSDKVYVRYKVGGEFCHAWAGSCKSDLSFQASGEMKVYLGGTQIMADNHWALLSTKDRVWVQEEDVIAFSVTSRSQEGFVRGLIRSENGRFAYTSQDLQCMSLFEDDQVPEEIVSGVWMKTFEAKTWNYKPKVLEDEHVFSDRQRFSPGVLLSVRAGERLYCRLVLPRSFCQPALKAEMKQKMCHDGMGMVCPAGYRCLSGKHSKLMKYGTCKEQKTVVSHGNNCADPKSVCEKKTYCINQQISLDPLVNIPTCKRYVKEGFTFGQPSTDFNSVEWQNRQFFACPPGLTQVGPDYECKRACNLYMKLYGGARLSASVTRPTETQTPARNFTTTKWSVLKSPTITVQSDDELRVEVTQFGRYLPFTGILSLSSGRVYTTNPHDWLGMASSDPHAGYSLVVFPTRPQENPFPGTTAVALSSFSDTAQTGTTIFTFRLPADACTPTQTGKQGSSCMTTPCDEGLKCGKDNRCIPDESPLPESQNCADGDRECGGGLWCRRVSGIQPMCMPRLKLGDACDAAEGGCAAGLFCETGSATCQLMKVLVPDRVKCIYRETPMIGKAREVIHGTPGVIDGAAVECMPVEEFLRMGYDRAFGLFRRGVSKKSALHVFHYCRAVVWNLRLCAPGVNAGGTVCVPKTTLYLVGAAVARLQAGVGGGDVGKLGPRQRELYEDMVAAAVAVDVGEMLPTEVMDWKTFAKGNGEPKVRVVVNASARDEMCGDGYRWYEGSTSVGERCCDEMCFTWMERLNVAWDYSMVMGCCEMCNRGRCEGVSGEVLHMSEVWVPSYLDGEYRAFAVFL